MNHKTKKRIPMDHLGVELARAGDIRVERLEERIIPRVPFPHKHDFYQISFFTAGQGWHEVDFTRYKIVKNHLFFMKPGQMHAWELSSSARGFILEFTQESLPLDLKKGLDLIPHYRQTADSVTLTSSTTIQQLKALCEIMTDEFKSDKKHSQTCLQGYLYGLLIQLLRELGELHKIETKNLDLVDSFHNILEKNYSTEHAVSFYAKQLRLTPKALTMRLARTLGQSPRQLIQERLILEAKRLVAFSDLSMAEVGYELGFEDANYFTRFFKEHVGMTPKKFKQTLNRAK